MAPESTCDRERTGDETSRLNVRLERRLKPSYAAGLSTLAVVLAIIFPALFVASHVVSETLDLAGNVRVLPFDTILAHAQRHALVMGGRPWTP